MYLALVVWVMDRSLAALMPCSLTAVERNPADVSLVELKLRSSGVRERPGEGSLPDHDHLLQTRCTSL